MSDPPNPYASPASVESSTSKAAAGSRQNPLGKLKTSTTQQLARHMLAHRAQGFSIAYVLWWSRFRYALQLAMLAGCVVLFNVADSLWFKGVSLWGAGMLCGAFLRDGAWIRRVQRNWPFTEGIADWEVVEALAEGRDPADVMTSPRPAETLPQRPVR